MTLNKIVVASILLFGSVAAPAWAGELRFSTGFFAYSDDEHNLDVTLHSSYSPAPGETPSSARVTVYDDDGAVVGLPTNVDINPGKANLASFALPALGLGETGYVRVDITCVKSKSCNKDRFQGHATVRSVKVRRAAASLLK